MRRCAGAAVAPLSASDGSRGDRARRAAPAPRQPAPPRAPRSQPGRAAPANRTRSCRVAAGPPAAAPRSPAVAAFAASTPIAPPVTATRALSAIVPRAAASGWHRGRCAARTRAVAAFAARQEQVGDVGAGDEQHESDGAEQHQQQRTHVADHVLGHRRHRGGKLHRGRIVYRQVGGEPCRHPTDVGRGLFRGDAVAQPRDTAQEVRAANGYGGAVETQRHEGLRRIRRVELQRQAEAGRQHAGDGERAPVQPDGAADDATIGAELTPPEAIGQQHHRVRTGRIVFGSERASELRSDAECRQHAVRDHAHRQPFRVALLRQRHAVERIDTEVLE